MGDASEVERLLGGRPGHAQYSNRSVDLDVTADVGGYEPIVELAASAGFELTMDLKGIALVDDLLDAGRWGAVGGDEFTRIAPVGLFFGNVVIQTVPGARWRVGLPRDPILWVRKDFGVAVMHVAERRLEVREPTLAENYRRLLALLIS